MGNGELSYQDLEKKIRELERKSEFFQLIADNTIDWEIFRDVTGKVLYTNKVFETITGYSADEFINGAITEKDLVLPEDWERIENRLLQSVMRIEPASDVEFRILTKDKQIKTVNLYSKPVFQDGKHIGFNLSIREVMQSNTLKQLQSANNRVEKSEQGYSIMFEKTATPTLLLKLPEFVIADANDAAQEITGYSKHELLEKNAAELGIISSLEREQIITEFKNKGSLTGLELQIKTKCGNSKTVIFNTNALELGGHTYALTTIYDITDRLRAENNILKSEELFRTLFNNTKDSILVMGIQEDGNTSNFLLVNDAACLNLGYTREELLQLSPIEIDVIGQARQVSSFSEKLIQEKHILFESEHIAKDGHKFPVEVSLNLFQLDGKPANIAIVRDISERKRAEEALQEREQRFSQLIQNSFDTIVILDSNGIQRYVSPSAEQVHGYSPTELIDISVIEKMIHPDDQERVLEAFQQIIETGSGGVQYRHRRKLGGWVHLEARGTNQLANPHIRGVVVNVRDITEQKQAEEALQYSEERMRLANKATNDVIWDWDVISDSQRWNEAGRIVFGWHEIVVHAVSASWWIERIHPDDRNKVNESFFAVVNNPQNDFWHDEYRFLKTDGSYAFVMDRGYVIRNNEGKAIRMIGAMLDITERKRAEEALKISEKKLNEAQVIGKMLSWELDLQSNRAYWSENAYLMYGLNPNEIEPSYEYFKKITHPDDLKTIETAFYELLNNQKPLNIESRIILPDGTLKWILSDIIPIIEDNNVVKLSGTQLDITERKKTEENLLEAKEKAEESDRLKTAFLQNMSHEIRTPMNAIMGFAGLIKINFNNKDKLEKFSTIIEQRCNDLLDIINDLLDIAKIESGQLELHISACDINKLFKEISEFFSEYRIRTGKQHISFNLHSNCPHLDYIILTDTGKLKQILTNLLTNAFKYTEEGAVSAHCRIEENNKLVFTITDTGVGIPEDKQTLVFERFAQLNQIVKPNIGGTGLGLSIVKGLVDLFGGEILLESKVGKGSIFTVKIPFKTEPMVNEGTTVLMNTKNVDVS